MGGHGVHFSFPEASLFKVPPSNEPRTLPPPTAGSTLSAPPFSVPASIYNRGLDVKIPITIACIYAASITALNSYNRSQGNKPWPVSKTKAFFWFVVAHNVFLAVYSAWTFIGMNNALRQSFEHWSGPAGLAGSVDSLCKMHGPSGFGNAMVYNSPFSQWASKSPTVRLGAEGYPDTTDVGRLWNEGLAFYGWIFYLSKFYEVVDSLIIVAKGKRSTTLQTYHHAGAMMCMWAGIRYMSPPIWLFVWINSGIHALMYTYYTVTAFAVPVPGILKQSLTTMQIIQFLVGASYAALHSFISYTLPVQVPSLSTSVANAASAVSSIAATESAGLSGLLKKFLFRAVGEEGLAENVNALEAADLARSRHGSDPVLSYRTEYQTIPCLETSGQTFAVWFNVLYLTPLTFLFVRFFMKSYLRRTGQLAEKEKGHQTKHGAAEKAGKDALKGIGRELDGGVNGSMNGRP